MRELAGELLALSIAAHKRCADALLFLGDLV